MKDSTKKKLRETLLFKPDLFCIINLIIAIGINLGGFYAAKALSLPLWLDTVGTVMVAISYGPLAGILISVISQIFIFVPLGLPFHYYLIGISVALVVGFLFPKKRKNDLFAIVTVAMITALVTSLLSFPLNAKFNNGYPGNLWGDQFFMMLSKKISSKRFNAYMAVAFIDFPDRLLSVLLGFSLIDLTDSHKSKKKEKILTKSMSGILALIMAGSLLAMNAPLLRAFDGDSENAVENDFDYESDFDTVVYDTDDGLLSCEANAVAQTDDGYIWVGTYAGLYRYNGIAFLEAKIDERIRNVMSLFVDSKGHLWIGTNDSGVFCFDPTTEEVTCYSTDNGLSANAVRAICEDKNGNIYLGTAMSVSRIDSNGSVKSFPEWKNVFHTISLDSTEDGAIIGVTNDGTLFLAKNDLLLDTAEFDQTHSVYYLAAACGPDAILVTTTGNQIVEFKVEDGHLEEYETFSINKHEYFSNIRYSELYQGFFYCGEYGFGFIEPETRAVSDMTEFGFRGSVEDVCVDSQSNIWFASSKHGILKCSHTPFRYLYYRTDLEENVANAVCECNGFLYIGLNKGVTIVNANTRKAEYRPWLQDLKNERVRNIMRDSKGNLWISTYGTKGLVKVEQSGSLIYFNEENGRLGTGQIRSCIELSDGRILVASNTGLSFIQDDKVVATLGEKDGLNNQFILSMIERDDGSILASSDGDGIYIIKNDRVVGHISEAEGLMSSVILRIVKGTSGYFYVSSSAIYFDDGNEIRMLKNFPYSNNYDILISDDGICWITSSAGMFVVDEKTMIEDGEYTCTLLNKNWGMNTSFTANSWNLINNGTLYLCCTDGVRSLSMSKYSLTNTDYQIHLDSIQAGEELIHEKNGTYIIPAINGRISFNLSVNNFTLTNPKIHYYLDGAEDEGITCRQNEILPLEYTNLAYGSYELHVQVLNEATGEIERDEVFKIEKKAMMYERIYFQLYLIFVLAMLACYVIWLFVTIKQRAAKIRGLQKEMSTDPMTGLYNKSASEKVLTKICEEEESGILMMIDLDSFKLVNDIYGHDMGDRILIRFAEIIMEAVGEGNMGGRLGGDEFIGFVKNTQDEAEVDRITDHLNKEIVKSAKEFMGEDMNIPLGASVGAVRIPADGRDFSKLFRYADKALYIVKQNGKHGYAFFQKRGDATEKDAADSEKNNLTQIKKIIGERNEGKGAFSVNFDKLQVIYKFLNRNNKVTGNMSSIVKFTIEAKDGSEVPDEIRDAFEDMLITNLKKNDIVNRYAGCFFTIFTDCDPENYDAIIKRLEEKWNENEANANYLMKAETESVE
ncbi:MAG: diguanylate cyclase [Clostridiales bacterium]|nr:diguanylate cyclase [Clostridiales bacterium]